MTSTAIQCLHEKSFNGMCIIPIFFCSQSRKKILYILLRVPMYHLFRTYYIQIVILNRKKYSEVEMHEKVVAANEKLKH